MSVLNNPSCCIDSIFLSCEKALGLSWTIQEEKLRSRIESRVSSLRGRDVRFALKHVATQPSNNVILQRCTGDLDKILCALGSDDLAEIRAACEGLTNLIDLDENGILACRLLPVFVLVRSDQLAEATCVLKKALMEFPVDSKLWIARGEVFLRMGAAALADIHFKQPCTKGAFYDILRAECKTRMLDAFPALSSLSNVDPHELRYRGEVVRDESFVKSAVWHFAAGFKYGTGDVQMKCFLNLIQCIYLLDNVDIWADSVLNAIDWAMQHYSIIYLELSYERARWLFAYRDYSHAADELQHLKQQKKGVLTLDEISLQRNIEKTLRSNAYYRVFPSRYRIGRTFGSGVSVNQLRVNKNFAATGNKVVLWIFGQMSIPITFASIESAICIGKRIGSIPDELGIPNGSCMAVHDFRTCPWFVPYRSNRLMRKYESENCLHFLCTHDMLVVYPLHPITCEDNNGMQQDIQITWSDILQAILRITSTKRVSETANILADIVAEDVECRRAILRQNSHEHSSCECSKIPSIWSTVDTFEALQTPILGLTLETAVPEKDTPRISKSRYPNSAAYVACGLLIIMMAMMFNPMSL